MLYGAIRRAGLALGFDRFVTYTLESEEGTSLRAAGFEPVALVQGGHLWSCPSRPREDKGPMDRKIRWEWGQAA